MYNYSERSLIIALGDNNAKIGQEIEYRIYIGTQSLHYTYTEQY